MQQCNKEGVGGMISLANYTECDTLVMQQGG